jgi:hypothetical protein
MRGRILRSSRPATLTKIRGELESLAIDMGHSIPGSSSKNHLLNKVQQYKKQNSFLRYAAIHQSVINICITYEDFVKRVILKYFEEQIQRLPSNKESLKNKLLIEAILRGDNIHRTLAESVAADLMHGSVEEWHDTLIKHKMNIVTSPHLRELFLVRNCIVHNNARVSSYLHQAIPTKYLLRKAIRLTVADVEKFKNEVHKSAVYIIAEYSRLHPSNLGTWL